MPKHKQGNVYTTGSDILSYKVTLGFNDGNQKVQIYAGSYATKLEARAAAKAVRAMRKVLRNLGYLPHQQKGRQPRTVTP